MPANMVKRKNIVLPHVSSLRNPLMAEVFHIAGKMEKTGRGLKLIHDQMDDLGRKLPEWESKDGRTKLTIYRSPMIQKDKSRVSEFIKTLQKGMRFSRQDYVNFWNNGIYDIYRDRIMFPLFYNSSIKKIGFGFLFGKKKLGFIIYNHCILFLIQFVFYLFLLFLFEEL